MAYTETLKMKKNRLQSIPELREKNKALEHSNQRLKTIERVAKIINSSLELDNILNNILKIIDEEFDYKYSAILLVDKDKLYVKAGRGFSMEVVKTFRPKIGTGCPGTSVKTCAPVLIEDVSKDTRYIDVNSPTKSCLAVPIVHEGKAIGATNIESDKLANFGQDDVELLTAISDQAGHAITNAQLYEKVKNFNKELKKKIEEATEDLRHANKELERLSEMKSDFVSTVSHELRTPLTSIQGYTALIKDGELGPVNDEQKEFLGIVKEETERLTRLIGDLLDVSKIEAGRMKLVFQDFNLLHFIDHHKKEMENIALVKKIKLKFILPKETGIVKADPDKIKQIFYNLMSNAMKFSKENTTITITVENKKNNIQISVKDQGMGMNKKDLDKIFGKFHQVDSKMTREIGGTGLGLTITQHLIEAHDGEIWVESEINKGATFCFSLPTS